MLLIWNYRDQVESGCFIDRVPRSEIFRILAFQQRSSSRGSVSKTKNQIPDPTFNLQLATVLHRIGAAVEPDRVRVVADDQAVVRNTGLPVGDLCAE